MEIQFHFQRGLYVVLAFVVLYVPDKSVGKCTLNVDNSGRPDIIGSFPCSQKYLMKSYFEKHDMLLDSDFQGFLAHELPIDSHKALSHNLSSTLRLSVLHRHLIGEGSHRRLFSSIRFHIQPEVITELPKQFCQAIVVERLPSGVFADPFELQHLVQRGVFNDAVVFGDTNLELPSALSNRSVVEVHMDIDSHILSRQQKGLDINIELPLHARYPPLDQNGYSEVEMCMPDLFLRCSIEKENLWHESCLWMMMMADSDSNTSSIVWRIPSGNNAHSGVVSIVTFISALLSAILIVLATTVFYRYP